MTKRPDPIDIHVGARLRMRRLMLDLSQTRLADGLGITFQQVQKYEKGVNRVSASRLQQISSLLQVPIAFFFEGLSASPGSRKKASIDPYPRYVSEFLASSDGVVLTKAFTQIKNGRVRRSIVDLVEEVAGRSS